MAILFTLTYSPWSERARWVLLHHRWNFEERRHVPFMGEFALRRAARRWSGKISVPLLVDGDTSVQDSLEIARYVDARGEAEHLLPPEYEASITKLNALAEAVVDAFRGRGIQLVAQDPEFALSFTPPALKRMPLAAAFSRFGSGLLARKYGVDMQGTRERIRDGIATMRAALGGRPYVNDRFSYADILIATTLQLMAPVGDRYIAMDPTMQRVWRDDELAREFRDLIQWRDELYARHRPVTAANVVA